MFKSFWKTIFRFADTTKSSISSQRRNIRFEPEPLTKANMQKKLSPEELQRLKDPLGFLDEKEKKSYEGLTEEGKLKDLKEEVKENPGLKLKVYSPNVKSSHINDMPEEYGFKKKGPEPTRYGDWDIDGRVSDF
mgnify:CR=1 FL=1